MAMARNDQLLSDQTRQCRRLAHVLTLTQQMLVLADNGEWEQVADKELERRDDLAACFDNSVAADSELIAEAIAALLHLNEELMAKLAVAKDEVLKRGREQTRNRSAVGSYQAVKSAF